VESQAKARDGLADRLAAGRSAITDETLVPARRSTRELRLISSPFHNGLRAVGVRAPPCRRRGDHRVRPRRGPAGATSGAAARRRDRPRGVARL